MNYGTELSGIYVYVLRILQCEINVYSGNVLVISSERVKACGSIKNTNKNIIVTFRFLNSKVCVCMQFIRSFTGECI